MTLEKTRIRLPLPGELFEIVKSILSPPDKVLFVAAWGDNMSDAEIAETFGADAAARARELERGIGKLVSIQLDCAAWRAAMEAYAAERDELKALVRKTFGGRGRRPNERKERERQ
ncbi:MAG: hypothetical protein IKY61_06855 [Thermoguttaceae bacterium]|nr:hypothetical protein [Thermoguttaceae bacterium]